MNNNARKAALITGAAKRLGASISHFLANNGWELILHYNNSAKEAEILANELNKLTKVSLIQADFNKEFEVEQIFKKANSNVSLLINNASAFNNDYFNNFSTRNLKKHLNINFVAPAILIRDFINQEFFKYTNAGNIINILDYSIYSYPQNFYSYTHSKMALANLVRLNAKLVAPKIRINGIAIGYVLSSNNQSKEHFEKLYKSSPLQVPALVEEVNNTINYILQTQSLTGEIITIDGGQRFVR